MISWLFHHYVIMKIIVTLFTGWIYWLDPHQFPENMLWATEKLCWVLLGVPPKKNARMCVCVFSLSFSGQNSFVYDIFMTFLVSLCRNTRECETCGIFGSALPFPVSPAQWELRQEVLIPQSRQSHLAKWSPLFGSAFSQLFSMVFWTNPNGFSFIANW